LDNGVDRTSLAGRFGREAACKTIEGAHEAMGLNYVERASAFHMDHFTLLRCRKQTSAPSPQVRDRMQRLREIIHRLGEVFESSEAGSGVAA